MDIYETFIEDLRDRIFALYDIKGLDIDFLENKSFKDEKGEFIDLREYKIRAISNYNYKTIYKDFNVFKWDLENYYDRILKDIVMDFGLGLYRSYFEEK